MVLVSRGFRFPHCPWEDRPQFRCCSATEPFAPQATPITPLESVSVSPLQTEQTTSEQPHVPDAFPRAVSCNLNTGEPRMVSVECMTKFFKGEAAICFTLNES